MAPRKTGETDTDEPVSVNFVTQQVTYPCDMGGRLEVATSTRRFVTTTVIWGESAHSHSSLLAEQWHAITAPGDYGTRLCLSAASGKGDHERDSRATFGVADEECVFVTLEHQCVSRGP